VGASCNTSCAVHPDPTLAFNHTWHDNSQFPAGPPVSLSLDFVGIAIDVFCIIPPLVTNNTALRYNLSFDLDDGTHRGTYTYTPTSSEFEYNVSVVSLPSLPNKAHTLLISTNDPVHGSIFLFDYAVYTTVEGNEDARPSTGTIAGCLFGAVFFLILLVLLRWRKQRKNLNRKLPPVLPVVEPFTASAVSESRTVVKLSRSPSSHSPSALVRQLQHALDTVVSMGQTSDRSESAAGVTAHTAGSESQYDTPPPVYQSRVGTSRS